MNIFEFKEDYVIGYTKKNEKFYFDKDDYEKVSKYTWWINCSGYPVTKTSGKGGVSRKEIFLHNLIMGIQKPQIDIVCDHIDRNRVNNRKYNLRMANRSENCININVRKDNVSGVIGVSWKKEICKWQVNIQKEKKSYYLGVYKDLDDAIKVRLKKEKEFFGEYAPQKHLFEKYNIGV